MLTLEGSQKLLKGGTKAPFEELFRILSSSQVIWIVGYFCLLDRGKWYRALSVAGSRIVVPLWQKCN